MREFFYLKYVLVIVTTWIFMYNKVYGLNSFSIYSVQDRSKQKYSSSNVLNQNCPCHKYQKKAEREYKQILRKEEHRKKLMERARSENCTQTRPNNISTSRKFFHFRVKSFHKTASFNLSRHREKKGFFNFFKKNIASCPF